MSSEHEKQDFASVMDKLRANYVLGLGGKAERLQETLTRAQAGDDEAVASLAQQVHRLAGTAGSFGVHDVSQQANDLDVRLHNGESHGELADELAAFIQLLRDRCAEAGTPPSE